MNHQRVSRSAYLTGKLEELEEQLKIAEIKIKRLENDLSHANHRQNPLYHNRVGVIRISDEFIASMGYELINKIFGVMIPMKVEFNESLKMYFIKAASWKFRPIFEGDPAPEYRIHVTRNDEGTHLVEFLECQERWSNS